MSPTPGRSTLITSAPNHASNCVQVGPDWTCVKSRIRTPLSAFVIVSSVSSLFLHGRKEMRTGDLSQTPVRMWPLFLANLALRIEVADSAALAAGGRVDHRVDEGRLAGVHRGVDGAFQLVGRSRID